MAYLRPESEGLADGCSKRIEIRWKQEENQRSGEQRRGEGRREGRRRRIKAVLKQRKRIEWNEESDGKRRGVAGRFGQ